MTVWAAFAMGLVGSLHCIGMCGPIAMSLPVASMRGLKRTLSALLYSLGRCLSYATLGIIAGLLGMGAQLAGYQGAISISAGILMLIGLVFTHLPFRRRFATSVPISWVQALFQQAWRAFFGKANPWSILGLGYVNGFLPCGLVYAAAAAALPSRNPLEGAAFMFVFGLGTLPVMSSLVLGMGSIQMIIRQRLQWLIPCSVILVACLLILRGLSLGIPYISPQLHSIGENAPSCCHSS